MKKIHNNLKYWIWIVPVSLMLSCGSSKVIRNTFQKNPLVIDGKSNDWKDTLQYDSNSKIWYSVTNDNDFLYLRLMFVDETLQRKIRMLGLTVWFDTTASRKKTFGIGFPVARTPDQEGGVEMRSRRGENNGRNFGEGIPLEMQDVEVFGYNDKKDYRKYIYSESPFKPVTGRGEFNSMTYELAVPLKEIFKNRGLIAGRALSVGFVTGKLDLSNRGMGGNGMPEGGMPGGRMPRGGGMGGGGMEGGGMPGGDMSGGMRGGGREGGRMSGGDFQSLQQSDQVWIKAYKIAAPVQ
jgi:hypothetical protein